MMGPGDAPCAEEAPKPEDEAAPQAPTVPRRWGHAAALALIVALYLGLCAKFITLLPLWGGVHDEQVHFGYSKYLAVRGALPPLPSPLGDSRFYYEAPSAGDAAHHPPGYYALGAVVLKAFAAFPTATQNYALRCLSLALGLVALLFAYATCRVLVPDEPSLALAVAAGMAVFPHWVLMSSVIYVETFGGMATSGALWMLARHARDPRRWGSLVAAGAFVGLMSLTKMTLLPLCLGVSVSALVIVMLDRSGPGGRLRRLAAFLLPAAAVGGWWYARNIVVHGQPFPTSDQLKAAAGQLDAVIMSGGKPADMMTLLFVPLGRVYYRLAITGIFRFFWGPSDWLPPGVGLWMYPIAAVTWVVPPVGVWRGLRCREAVVRWAWPRFLLPLSGGLLLLVVAYVRWTVTTAIQAHGEFGKFVMPLFGFAVCTFAISARALLGPRWAVWLMAAFVAFFLAWDLLAVHHIATVLIPRYAPSLVPVP